MPYSVKPINSSESKAMNHLGLPAGPLRLPLIELGEEKKQQLIALLTENGGAST